MACCTAESAVAPCTWSTLIRSCWRHATTTPSRSGVGVRQAPPSAPPGPARWRWEVRAAVFGAVMAMSRVYLRAHWLSDTVAGALLGAGLALGVPALLMAVRERIQQLPTAR